MSLSFPKLKVSSRRREFDAYQPHERATVVYEYLFNGQSHRQLDANVLGQDVHNKSWMAINGHFALPSE